MTVFVAVLYVRCSMVVEILTRAFDTVMKAAALNLLKFRWRGVPASGAVSRRRWFLRQSIGPGCCHS
jgi:hypothetical protein